jgi:glucose-1-phosphate thymidylyltransferase
MPRENTLANPSERFEQEVIGLIPAAGLATRLAPLPCSKELYPVGFGSEHLGKRVYPKAVCQYLLEKMRLAGISKAYIILREGKWDIPAYLGDGSTLGLPLAYLMMGLPFGAPYTLDQAYPFVRGAIVALGFPDILFEPEDGFVQVLDRLAAGDVDVVLGLCPAGSPQKMDMVDVLDNGRIERLVIKPQQSNLRYSWAVAVWKPVFTTFMHEYLARCQETAAQQPEMFVGDVFNAAIQEGLKVEGVLISDKPYLDIGTGDDLLKAVKRCLAQVK